MDLTSCKRRLQQQISTFVELPQLLDNLDKQGKLSTLHNTILQILRSQTKKIQKKSPQEYNKQILQLSDQIKFLLSFLVEDLTRQLCQNDECLSPTLIKSNRRDTETNSFALNIKSLNSTQRSSYKLEEKTTIENSKKINSPSKSKKTFINIDLEDLQKNSPPKLRLTQSLNASPSKILKRPQPLLISKITGRVSFQSQQTLSFKRSQTERKKSKDKVRKESSSNKIEDTKILSSFGQESKGPSFGKRTKQYVNIVNLDIYQSDPASAKSKLCKRSPSAFISSRPQKTIFDLSKEQITPGPGQYDPKLI